MSEKRRQWEREWEKRSGEEFHWYLSEAPPELVELLDKQDLPAGAALDIGCGNGIATTFLARRFHPAVGMDIALSATRQALALARAQDGDASFVVAEAPVLPFRSAAFGVVFDRGCLQAIPRSAWGTYFQEVERVLMAGGVLQLYVSRPDRRLPKLLSPRGIRARMRRLRRGGPGGPTFLSPQVIREHVPNSMHEVTMKQFDFDTKAGTSRRFVYALFRRG